jgi:hypothetical protein
VHAAEGSVHGVEAPEAATRENEAFHRHRLTA